MYTLSSAIEDAKMDVAYAASQGESGGSVAAQAAINLIQRNIAPVVCRVVGHNVECDDYGTPDSGGMGWHCARCGVGSWTQLY